MNTPSNHTFMVFHNNILQEVLSHVPYESWFSVFQVSKQWAHMATLVFDPSIHNNTALIWALKNERFDVVMRLIQDPRVDPSIERNLTIVHACQHKKIDIVRHLLKDKRVDPNARYCIPLAWACANNDSTLRNLLLHDERVNLYRHCDDPHKFS